MCRERRSARTASATRFDPVDGDDGVGREQRQDTRMPETLEGQRRGPLDLRREVTAPERPGEPGDDHQLPWADPYLNAGDTPYLKVRAGMD
jgi:hypothetical protein